MEEEEEEIFSNIKAVMVMPYMCLLQSKNFNGLLNSNVVVHGWKTTLPRTRSRRPKGSSRSESPIKCIILFSKKVRRLKGSEIPNTVDFLNKRVHYILTEAVSYTHLDVYKRQALLSLLLDTVF